MRFAPSANPIMLVLPFRGKTRSRSYLLPAAKRCLVMPLGAKLDERKVRSQLGQSVRAELVSREYHEPRIATRR